MLHHPRQAGLCQRTCWVETNAANVNEDVIERFRDGQIIDPGTELGPQVPAIPTPQPVPPVTHHFPLIKSTAPEMYPIHQRQRLASWGVRRGHISCALETSALSVRPVTRASFCRRSRSVHSAIAFPIRAPICSLRVVMPSPSGARCRPEPSPRGHPRLRRTL